MSQRNVLLRRLRLAAAAGSRVQAPPAGDGLEIAGVRAFRLREPSSARRYVLLRLETRSGLVGYGECPELSEHELALLQRTLPGTPVTAFERIGRRLASQPMLRAAANMALLDIAAKHAQVPLFRFLGGPTRFKVRVMTALEGDSDAVLIEALKRARAAGHRAFSVPLPPVAARNQGRAFVLATQRRMESLRAAAGEEADFVLNGAAALSPADAANLCEALQQFHLYWFDEPFPASNLPAARRLAAESITPLGFGRNLTEPLAFQNLLREDAVDVLRPDICRHGVTEIRKLAAMAECYYVAVAPYHDGGPVATAAALHLAASLPNFFIQEIPFPGAEAARLMRTELIGAPVEHVKDGFAQLPLGPGLGISISEQALNKYKDEQA